MSRDSAAAAVAVAGGSEFFRYSVRQLGDALRSGAMSATDLVYHYLERIQRLNPQLNAFVHVDADGAMEAASASDTRLRAARPLSALDGIPVAVKDNLLMRNCPATWGSALYADYVPLHDELPVANLRSSGAILLGKTNVPELAMRGFTGNAVYGVTRNPWDLDLTPGGSSGGAVAAVAAGLAPLALATDGGGSIRRPAANTNLVGLKTSLGRIRRGNGFPQLMFDCETVGPIARSVDAARLMFGVLANRFSRTSQRKNLVRRPRILYVEEIGDAPVDPEIRRVCAAAADRLVSLGYHVTRGDLPFAIEPAMAALQTVTDAGFAGLSNRNANFRNVASPDFAAQAEAGARLSATAYWDSVQLLFDFRTKVSQVFDHLELIMTPATAAQPWPAEEPFPSKIAEQPVGPRGHAVFTAWVNACGHPAIALPAGQDFAGLPVGFQLIAQNGGDEFLLDIAEDYETAFCWADQWPRLALG